MSDVFLNKPVSRAFLIVNDVAKEILPVCQEGYGSLCDQLCDCLREDTPFIVWGIHGDRFTVGPNIIRDCILIEK